MVLESQPAQNSITIIICCHYLCLANNQWELPCV
ncbi:unnamed protein product [Brassica oleracea]|uniref:(rape) hypothetical protein n=1 Tax=Brassica napus TaxID=3708 RepID=A0A816MIY3_BRANA|nr:unnamed protein product [Brassica napus]